MKTPTYQIYLADAAVRQSIERQARSARADAILRHVVRPVLGFCGALLQMPTVTGPRLEAR